MRHCSDFCSKIRELLHQIRAIIWSRFSFWKVCLCQSVSPVKFIFAVIPSGKKAGLMIIIAVMNIFSAETCVISGYGVPEKVMSRRKRGEENAGMIAGKMMAVIHTVIAAGNDEMTAHKEARFA